MKPLKEIDTKVCNTTRVCVVDGRKFLDRMRHENMCFAIFSKDRNKEVEEVLVEVAKLLEEFLDIVSDNVHDGLPPV